ncbi:MAG TPA: hypothetical protein VI704_05610, partial [Bacteroidota bacterium]|nr:hypothetical protein [Bacteroidota bacterium]
MRKLLRIAFYFSVTALFLAVAVLGFTQTRYFRSYLRNIILQSSPEYINGIVRFDGLEGNLVTGTQIHNVALLKDSTEIFAAERVDIKYDVTAFLFGRVALSNVTLVNPRIHVWRSVDGSLNVTQIVKPRPDTSSSAGIVDIKNAEIRNARITFIDSLVLKARREGAASPPPPGGFDYAFFQLESFHMSGGARIEAENLVAQIRKLSFESRKQRFKMTYFAGDFILSPSLAAFRNCVIETRNSLIKLEGQLKDIDVTTIKALAELERAHVQLSLDAQKLDTRELKQFLYPTVDFLDKTISLEAKASGTFRTLSVDGFSLKTPRSFIKVQGRISNLHKPQNLELELACIDNRFHPADAVEFTPGLTIPDLRFLGEIRYNLVFAGKLDEFTVRLAAQTDAGEIQMDGSLRVQPSLAYKATVYTKNVDLGIVTQDDNLRSQLNARITLNGAGTNLRTMSTVVRVEIDSSSVSDIFMNRTVVVLDVNERVVRAHATATIGTASYDVSGRMQFHKDSTSFQFNGRVGSFDLGQILKSPLYESDLTFELTAEGSWLDATRMRSNAGLTFSPSSFNKQPFDSATVQIQYDTRDSVRQSFHLSSDVADISIDGKFGVGSFISNAEGVVEVVSKAIAYRAKHLDSLRAFLPFQLPDIPRFQAGAGVKRESIDAAYILRIHNFYPLGVFLHEKLGGSLYTSGVLAGNIDALRWNGEVVSGDFDYNTPSFVLGTRNVQAKWDFDGISRSSILKTFTATIDLQSEVARVNEIAMSNVALALGAKGTDATFTLSTLVDSTAQINVMGQLTYRGALYHVDIGELKVGFGSFLYENSDPISLALGKDGFLFKSLSMRHEAEELTATGYFNPVGVSDLDISLKGFLLNNLQQMVKTSRLPEALKEMGGIVSGRLLVRGSLEHPNISFEAVADGVRTGETVFGQVESRFSYFEHMLDVFVSYRYNPQDGAGVPDMLFKGSVPYELPLSAAHQHHPNGQIDFALQSKGVRMELFGPFIPFVENLSGFLTCDMKIRGPMDAPEYDGFLSLSAARFLFKPLNIQYILDGRFVSDKKSVVLQSVKVKNISEDQSSGLMNLSGNFTLKGLKLGGFDLLANGQLLLMKETSRPAGAKFYGDLFAATGPSGVRWNGEVEKSYLTGEVFVKNGKLILPPERETVFLESRNIAIVFRDDTSKSKPEVYSAGEKRGDPGSFLALNNP